MKVGFIRCQQTEDVCPGTTDFAIAAAGGGALQEVGPAEVVGFVSCGGCPGKRAVQRAKRMVERGGATVIIFTSCMKKGTPFGFPCPHFDLIRAAVQRAVKDKAVILDYSHD